MSRNDRVSQLGTASQTDIREFYSKNERLLQHVFLFKHKKYTREGTTIVKLNDGNRLAYARMTWSSIKCSVAVFLAYTIMTKIQKDKLAWPLHKDEGNIFFLQILSNLTSLLHRKCAFFSEFFLQMHYCFLLIAKTHIENVILDGVVIVGSLRVCSESRITVSLNINTIWRLKRPIKNVFRLWHFSVILTVFRQTLVFR